jgi:tRNA1(Val) A37 N6-methylase TrmN6
MAGGQGGDTGAFEYTRDAFLGGRLTLEQPTGGFRAGSDAVLLAAAVPAHSGRVLEAGCGVGAAMLCLARRAAGVNVTGLELQPELAALARRNAAANGLAERVSVVEGSLHAPPPGLLDDPFDHAFANPPFFAAGRHEVSPIATRALARSEGNAAGTLAAWTGFLMAAVRPGGTVTMIHRAERLDEILALLPGAVVLPLLPGAGRPPKRVLVRAVRGFSGPADLRPGFVLHRPDGSYTAAAEAILRHGEPLVF